MKKETTLYTPATYTILMGLIALVLVIVLGAVMFTSSLKRARAASTTRITAPATISVPQNKQTNSEVPAEVYINVPDQVEATVDIAE